MRNMQVSQNFALPTSPKSRNKIRPDSLLEVLNTCNHTKTSALLPTKVVQPCFLPTINSNNNNDVTVLELRAAEDNNVTLAESIKTKNRRMEIDSVPTREVILSQPCFPESTPAGATKIFPHLYLGSQRDVVDEKMMRTNGITYVLNVSKRCKQPDFIDDSHFLRISVRDSYQEKITPHMHEAIEFIETVRRSNQRVLVHCLAGVSRSATIAIAYVLHYLRVGFEEAYRFVKEKRPSISPNFNFLGQLMEFELELRETGHMNTKRTESVSGHKDEEINFVYDNKDSDIWNKNPDCLPLSMPASCSYVCTNSHKSETIFHGNLPNSSVCRQRSDPALTKFCFSSRSNSPSKEMFDTTIPASENSLFVDVCVAAPPTQRNYESNCRLGSDGNEVDEESTSAVTVTCIPSIAEKIHNDEASSNKNQTAIGGAGHQVKGKVGLWQSLNSSKFTSRHRRCVSGGDITGISFETFNMKRRFDSQSIDDIRKEQDSTDESMNIDFISGFKRGALSSGGINYDHLEPSPKFSYKFPSFHSRSPKILRKSPNFTLNLQSVHSKKMTKGTLKSEATDMPQNPASEDLSTEQQLLKFDCSHNLCTPAAKRLSLSIQPDKGSRGQQYNRNNVTCMTVGSISPLTLCSPSADKNETTLFKESKTTSPTSSVRCKELSTRSTSNDYSARSVCDNERSSSSTVIRKASFEHTSTASNVSRPFLLSSGCDLKLRWRTKDRRRQSADSGYLSSPQSSFTSPVSQQRDFNASESGNENLVDASLEKGCAMISQSNLPCHVEGVFGNNPSDEESDSNTEKKGRKASGVGQRAGVEIMSCS